MLRALSLTEDEKHILELIQSNQIPAYRQAYSDRTAWLMACLSELVYQPFDQLNEEATKDMLQRKLNEFLTQKTAEALNRLITEVTSSTDEQLNKIFDEADEYSLTVSATYNNNDTQALLISTKRYIALVFRGTEANSFKDIKTDMNAIKTKANTSGGIHSGFQEAFDFVAEDIQFDLNKASNSKKPLIITGHSLGGALATIAAKRLTHKGGIACC